MAGLNDYPELKAVFDKLMAEKEVIRARVADDRREYTKLREQMGPLQARAHVLKQKIRNAEQPRLGEIDNQLAAIARAAGGRGTGRPASE